MRKLSWFTLGFVAGVLPCACFYGDWIFPVCLCALIVTAIFAFIYKSRGICRCILILLLGCTVGLGWFLIYDGLFVAVPRVADGQTGYVTIEASDYSEETSHGSSVEGNVTLAGKSYRVKAYLREKVQLKPGDTASGYFRFRLTTAGGNETPTSHRTEGIFLLAYPVSNAEITQCAEVPIRYYPAKWRNSLLRRMDEVFPEDAKGFAKALLLGDKSDISYEINTAFKVSGISHIIAVSGLHVSILFGLIYTLLLKKRLLSCLVMIPVLILFAAIVGFTPSVTRACIMQSLMLIAMAANREYDAKTELAFAVLVMLVANPMAVLSVSLQLSVCSVLGILVFSERIQNRILPQQKIRKSARIWMRLQHWIAASVSVTLSAMVFTVPLVAYYFGCVSVVGVLTNLLTLWVISFVFYGITLALTVSIISMTVASWFGFFIAFPIRYVLQTALLLSKVPFAAVFTRNIYIFFWLIGVYVFLLIFYLQKKKRPALLLCCVALTLMISQLAAWSEPLRDDIRVTVLDVGQGQSILLQADGKTFLVDCGGDDSKQAADVAAETLLNQGISRLDGIIVTHFDEDHAGGIPYLLTRIKSDRLILPFVRDDAKVGQTIAGLTDGSVAYITDDVVYTFGDTEMTIIAPISYNTGNESSLCILFHNKECDILITGDRGELGEMMLLREHDLPQLDLLIVGHHGSSGSTGKELLAITKPETAIISVGEDNRYGHPSDAVLERLAVIGCKVFRTDLHGTVIFRR